MMGRSFKVWEGVGRFRGPGRADRERGGELALCVWSEWVVLDVEGWGRYWKGNGLRDQHLAKP